MVENRWLKKKRERTCLARDAYMLHCKDKTQSHRLIIKYQLLPFCRTKKKCMCVDELPDLMKVPTPNTF